MKKLSLVLLSLLWLSCSSYALSEVQLASECKKINQEKIIRDNVEHYLKSIIENSLDVAEAEKVATKQKLSCILKASEENNTLLTSYQDELKNLITEADKKEKQQQIEELNTEIAALNTLYKETVTELYSVNKKLNSNDLSKIFTTDKSMATVILGTQFSNKYDSDGNSGGLTEKRFYGTIGIDTRWPYKTKKRRFFADNQSLHLTATLDLRSEPLINCDKVTDTVEKSECTDNDSFIPDDFNDINDTLTAAIKLTWNFYESENGQYAIGIPLQFGVKTRDKVNENGDSSNSFRGLGLRFVINDFFDSPYSSKAKNGLPFFYFDVSGVRYDDGFREISELSSKTRTLVDAGVRAGELPIYIGFRHNGGKGPDDTALTISYVFQGHKFLNIF